MSNPKYGIGVTKNRFELFDSEDEDPIEILKLRELEKETKKKQLNEKENKGNSPVTKAQVSLPRKGIKDTQNLKTADGQKPKEAYRTKPSEKLAKKPTPVGRDGRYNRLNNEDRSTGDRSRDTGPVADSFSGNETGDDSWRTGGRGGRGRGASRGNDRRDGRGKQDYDRHSGSDKTGVKPVSKRDGSGAYNWGNTRDKAVGLENPSDEGNWTISNKVEDPSVTNDSVPERENKTQVNVEDEMKELTLDEWKALKRPKQRPSYNIRKAGEGENLTEWENMYALQKKKDEEGEEYYYYEYENHGYPQRVGRQKHILDIDIHFKDNRERGPGKGRGGRAATSRPADPRPMNQLLVEKVNNAPRSAPKSAPKVDDEHDFPSLG